MNFLFKIFDEEKASIVGGLCVRRQKELVGDERTTGFGKKNQLRSSVTHFQMQRSNFLLANDDVAYDVALLYYLKIVTFCYSNAVFCRCEII